MPQLFKIGSYVIYFWISEGITRAGKCLLQNNHSQIPDRELRIMMRVIEARSADVIDKWTETFGETTFFC